MATLAEVEAFRTTLEDVNMMAQTDINAIFQQLVAGLALPHQELRNVLTDVMPGVLDPYASTIGTMTQDFYYADRAGAGLAPYRGNPAPVLPAQQQIQSLVGYGISALKANPAATALAVGLLAGGAQRLLFNTQRDTLFTLADNDPGQPTYQRMTTSAEPCDFCIMLASRGAVYDSQASAGGVVGRGVPLGQNKGNPLGGRTGKGIRPRGPKTIGERYHDNDKCVAVAVHPGRRQEMDREAVAHFELYAMARAKVENRNLRYDQFKLPDGSLKRKYRWEDAAGHIVSSDEQTKRLLAEMRKLRNGLPA